MKNLTPKLMDFPYVEVVVDNKMLLDDVQKIKRRVENTLIKTLRNDDIKLTLRLARQEEIERILSTRELYEKACEANPAVKKLGEMLGMEFV